MLEQVVSLLITDPDGRYVDCTLGLGGHSLRILDTAGSRMEITGIDRDLDAIEEAKRRLMKFGRRMNYIHGNFADIDLLLAGGKYEGFLFDLGLSSFQISDRKRGFSYLDDRPLDMCMGSGGGSVIKLLATASEGELHRIIRDYGEERKGRGIARTIVRIRGEKEIKTTGQLRSIVEMAVPSGHLINSLSRVFQAFRIWANKELENLEAVLPKAVEMLMPGGRIVVMSYHSLEDRIVKNFFRSEEKGCICPSDFPVCNCGKKPELKVLTRRPMIPGDDEIAANSRARSARLRAAERL